jgi:hypothetical protein
MAMKINNKKKSFFVVIDGSEEVLYLKCLDLDEAENEVKRFLKVDALNDSIEIIY